MGMAYKNYKFTVCLGMMSVCFMLFLTLGLYLDSVLPSAFGLRKPWNYFILPSYWCQTKNSNLKLGTSISKSDEEHGVLDSIFNYDDFETKHIKKENYESPSSEMMRQEKMGKFLKIHELKKTFQNGFCAVKGLNLKMYNG